MKHKLTHTTIYEYSFPSSLVCFALSSDDAKFARVYARTSVSMFRGGGCFGNTSRRKRDPVLYHAPHRSKSLITHIEK